MTTIQTVPVALGERSYEVRIGLGLIADAGAHLGPLLRRPRVAIVTDETVAALHLPALTAALSASGIEAAALPLPAGEATKSWAELGRTVEWLIAQKVERGDLIVALGGGVIGDLAGFAAAMLALAAVSATAGGVNCGRVALHTWWTAAEFKDVTVTASDGRTLWSGLPDPAKCAVGKDGKWTNVKNWQANGRLAVETPTDVDSVAIGKAGGKGKLEIELPWGVTVVSNLVMKTPVTWRRERKAAEVLDGEGAEEANAALPCLDVFDLAGNDEFVVRGEVQFCAKGVNTTAVPLIAEKGTRLALAAHNHVPYKSVTVEGGATLLPFDYAVEFERLILKPGHSMTFSPPRHFNRWRPVWVMHAKNLTGEPNYPKIPGWHKHLEKFQDGSTLLAIGFGE